MTEHTSRQQFNQPKF